MPGPAYNPRVSTDLRVENLEKEFRMGDQCVAALRGIDLSIEQGEFVALMGASGSGKSTLLHLCGGLDAPTAGLIEIEGHDLAKMSDRERTLFRRKRLGVVFQAFNLLPTLTARENVALPLLVAGVKNGQSADKTDKLLDSVDLLHRADHRPDALSGGEQQRVAIARSLINDPVLILADEPTGNLDSKHGAAIWRLLKELCKTQKRTILAVTHEAAGAAYADRVLVLKDGLLVGEIKPRGEDDAALVAARCQELAG